MSSNPTNRSSKENINIPEKESIIEFGPITLPSPRFDNDSTFFEAVKNRKTTRTIQDKKLPLQVLSNLLWSACGINRKKGPFGIPGRTAASASNSQEIDLYVAMEEGVYHYESVSHNLIPVLEEDLREPAIGSRQQWNGGKAPVQLIYVADIAKFSKAGYQEPGLYDPEMQKAYYYVDTGLIAQNVFLFASSQGLAAWFHNCDRETLTEKLNLREKQRVLFGQTVGYPETDE